MGHTSLNRENLGSKLKSPSNVIDESALSQKQPNNVVDKSVLSQIPTDNDKSAILPTATKHVSVDESVQTNPDINKTIPHPIIKSDQINPNINKPTPIEVDNNFPNSIPMKYDNNIPNT